MSDLLDDWLGGISAEESQAIREEELAAFKALLQEEPLWAWGSLYFGYNGYHNVYMLETKDESISTIDVKLTMVTSTPSGKHIQWFSYISTDGEPSYTDDFVFVSPEFEDGSIHWLPLSS